MSACPICSLPTTLLSGQCGCNNSRQQDLIQHTAVPTAVISQQFIPGTYPTASPNSPYPITDSVQRYTETTNNVGTTNHELNPYYSSLPHNSTGSATTTSSIPPSPLPLSIQHSHILAMEGLDDLAKAQEIAKERLLFEIAALQENLYQLQAAQQHYYSGIKQQDNNQQLNHDGLDHTQQHGDQVQEGKNNHNNNRTQIDPKQRIVTIEEQDLILKIDILSNEYRLLVFESTERGKELMKNFDSKQNNKKTISTFSALTQLVTNRLPRLPQLNDFEQETQRYILGAVTIGVYAGMFLLYQNRFGTAAPTTTTTLVRGDNGENIETTNDLPDSDATVPPSTRDDSTTSGGILSTIGGATSTAFTLTSNLLTMTVSTISNSFLSDENDRNTRLDEQSKDNSWSAWLLSPWTHRPQTRSEQHNQLDFDTRDGTGRLDLTGQAVIAGESVLDSVSDSTYDQIYSARTGQ